VFVDRVDFVYEWEGMRQVRSRIIIWIKGVSKDKDLIAVPYFNTIKIHFLINNK
jgi:hypothetical protein